MTEGAVDLVQLDASALTEWLVGEAQAARAAALQGDADRLRGLVDRLRAAARELGGERLRLVEVAEAYVRLLGRTDLSPAERALRAFLKEQRDDAEWVCQRWLQPALVAEGDVTSRAGGLAVELARLVDAGVAERTRQGWLLRPAHRALVLDLVEPIAFRLWRQVEEARRRIRDMQMNKPAATEYLAGTFGVDEQQAGMFFARAGFDQPTGIVAPAVVGARALYEHPLRWERARPPMAAKPHNEPSHALEAALLVPSEPIGNRATADDEADLLKSSQRPAESPNPIAAA